MHTSAPFHARIFLSRPQETFHSSKPWGCLHDNWLDLTCLPSWHPHSLPSPLTQPAHTPRNSATRWATGWQKVTTGWTRSFEQLFDREIQLWTCLGLKKRGSRCSFIISQLHSNIEAGFQEQSGDLKLLKTRRGSIGGWGYVCAFLSPSNRHFVFATRYPNLPTQHNKTTLFIFEASLSLRRWLMAVNAP